MTPLVWLAAAAIAGVGAYLVGKPALEASRGRGQRDLNEERYLAWRGRAARPDSGQPAGMTAAERRRAWIAGGLAAIAIICLIAFFVG